MRLIYCNKNVEEICTDLKKATRFMGGNKACAISLMARITALKSANDLKDIINFPPFHFHKLKNNG